VILLSAITSAGPRLAVKLNSEIVILDEARTHIPAVAGLELPLTLDDAVRRPDVIPKVRQAVEAIGREERNVGRLFHSESAIRIGLPLLPRNIICVGLNYKDHALEGGRELPSQPMLFAKWANCLIGPGESIVLPVDTQEVDYEAELAVVIGRQCQRVAAEDALDYVAGYSCMNDVSARDFQRTDKQFTRAKSQDTFGPLGPYLVTRDEIDDPQSLFIRCRLNGQVMQDASTSQMIFSVRELIAFISRGITLMPGDVISTGTPHGVGFARKPPVFLKAGDEVSIEIEKVGTLNNPVASIDC
jgi:2-keto-4-pentenoate hydratase/2-oxohepta-3-ene-1,7-dioic acid hydratase in catechol pathway